MLDKIFQKQQIMRRVVATLLVLLVFSTYLYGWRVLLVNAVVLVLGVATEWVFTRARGRKVSEAVLVTCLLFGLALPPLVPLWVAAIGIIFAVAVAKEMFGGFGRNVFNPAISGRLFIYITFPLQVQHGWTEPRIPQFVTNLFGIDALTGATPLELLAAEAPMSFWQLFLGFRMGSVGESAIWLILIAAVYLIATKTAQWRLMVSTFLAALALHAALFFSGVGVLAPHFAVLSGSLIYVVVFMTTDPVSAPNKPGSQWLYGLIIGVTTVLIREFAGFPEGTSFGILLGNIFASLLDELMPKPKPKKKPATRPAPRKPDTQPTAAKSGGSKA